MDQDQLPHRLILIAAGSVAALVGACTIALLYLQRRLGESCQATDQRNTRAGVPTARLPPKETTERGNPPSAIREIADQTRLIANNLSLEIAQDLWKGGNCAGIANRTQAIAEQMARATEDISRTIGGIQRAPRSPARSIGNAIRQVAEDIDMARRASAILDELRRQPCRERFPGGDAIGSSG